MFIRYIKNRSGSVSVKIISKKWGDYRVIKNIGYGRTEQEIALLKEKAEQELSRLNPQARLFTPALETSIEDFLGTLNNDQISVIGPELIFGRIYDGLGFSTIPEDLFRHLVVTRLISPGSKLKTIDYLNRYQGIDITKDQIYRFLDKLESQYKEEVGQLAFNHTLKTSGGKIGVVFYDMTTLHFEASDEDDLRKTGFSKTGKHQKPQIYLGLLVSMGGYPIGYDIFEGNIYEGHTLIPFLQKFEQKYSLDKPIVVADAGLLTNKNIAALESNQYEYILGARIKNESDTIKKQVLALSLETGMSAAIEKSFGQRLIVSYSETRAKKDAHNRKRGLAKLEKNLKSGKLTKSNINKRGYNKYLRLEGEIKIKIDYEKFAQDSKWDGLKGYITNTKLDNQNVIENYSNLWQIERAFRISKTDLRIRPIYHRLKHRIEAHICIAFTAYSIYKELDRLLKLEECPFSARRAAELTKRMYQISFVIPGTNQTKNVVLKMSPEQRILNIIVKNHF